jgi:hypothetical protein
MSAIPSTLVKNEVPPPPVQSKNREILNLIVAGVFMGVIAGCVAAATIPPFGATYAFVYITAGGCIGAYFGLVTAALSKG